jgi:DNA-binding GntR family transcriptional regulator
MLHKKIIEAMERKDADLCEYLVAKDIERTGMLERSRIRYAEAKAGPSG